MRTARASKRIVGAALAMLTAIACGTIGYDVDESSYPAIVTSSAGAGLSDTVTGVVGAGGAFAGGAGGADVGGAGGFASQAGAGGSALGPTSAGTGTAVSGTGGSSAATGGANGSGSGAGGASDAGVDPAGSGGASGTGGLGGGAGADDGGADAAKEAGPVGRCDDGADISLLYRHIERGGPIDIDFKVANRSNRSVPLRSITVRYYMANELVSPTASILYGDICCPDISIYTHVNAVVVPMNPRAPDADTYLEVTFDGRAGNLDPGHAVEVEVLLGGSVSIIPNQNNDYSYIASASGPQRQWDTCPGALDCDTFRSCVATVFVGGALVWGTPP